MIWRIFQYFWKIFKMGYYFYKWSFINIRINTKKWKAKNWFLHRHSIAIKNYIGVNISYPSNHYSKSSPPNLTGSWRKSDGSFLWYLCKKVTLYSPKQKWMYFTKKVRNYNLGIDSKFQDAKFNGFRVILKNTGGGGIHTGGGKYVILKLPT